MAKLHNGKTPPRAAPYMLGKPQVPPPGQVEALAAIKAAGLGVTPEQFAAGALGAHDSLVAVFATRGDE